jgi:hypothetical protein
MKIRLCTENNFRESPPTEVLTGGSPNPDSPPPLIRGNYSGGQLLLKLNGRPRGMSRAYGFLFRGAQDTRDATKGLPVTM